MRFRWEKFFLWLVVAGVAALAVGQLAAWVGGYIRPVGVFPLVIGTLLGGLLVGGVRLLDLAHRTAVLVGLLWATAVCAGSEHWGSYLRAQREYERQLADWQAKTQGLIALSSQFAHAIQDHLPRPPGSFGDYLSSQLSQGRQIGPWRWEGRWVWISWVAEAALVGLGAGAWLWPTLRWPYCTQCESWYRTIRQARLLPEDFLRLAELLKISNPRPPEQGRFRAYFRLWQCLGQCSPGRVELVWENPEGKLQRFHIDVDSHQREKLDLLGLGIPQPSG